MHGPRFALAFVLLFVAAATPAAAQAQQPAWLVVLIESPAEAAAAGATLVTPGAVSVTMDALTPRLALADLRATLRIVDAPPWLEASVEPSELTFRPAPIPDGTTWRASGSVEMTAIVASDSPPCVEAPVVVEVTLHETRFTSAQTARTSVLVATSAAPCLEGMRITQNGEYVAPATADEPDARDVPSPALVGAPLVALVAAALRRRSARD